MELQRIIFVRRDDVASARPPRRTICIDRLLKHETKTSDQPVASYTCKPVLVCAQQSRGQTLRLQRAGQLEVWCKLSLRTDFTARSVAGKEPLYIILAFDIPLQRSVPNAAYKIFLNGCEPTVLRTPIFLMPPKVLTFGGVFASPFPDSATHIGLIGGAGVGVPLLTCASYSKRTTSRVGN